MINRCSSENQEELYDKACYLYCKRWKHDQHVLMNCTTRHVICIVCGGSMINIVF